uniref:Uncharacterized protein n=1 Tax=Romanomermis culicivorax TaxID=13658 RepID=A0A915L5T7_ROMCU
MQSNVSNFICNKSTPGNFVYITSRFRQNRYLLNLTLKTDCRLAIEIRYERNDSLIIQQEFGPGLFMGANNTFFRQLNQPFEQAKFWIESVHLLESVMLNALQLDIIDENEFITSSSLGRPCHLCKDYVFPAKFSQKECHVSSITNVTENQSLPCKQTRYAEYHTK